MSGLMLGLAGGFTGMALGAAGALGGLSGKRLDARGAVLAYVGGKTAILGVLLISGLG